MSTSAAGADESSNSSYAPETSLPAPHVTGQDLQRLLSHSSVSTEGTRQNSFNKARARAKLVQRDKDVAQAEYEKKHHEEGH
jgi:hypothetical protein